LVASLARGDTLSRPALARGHLAWGVAGRDGSALRLAQADGSHARTLLRSRVRLLGSPALGAGEIAYTEQGFRGSRLVVRRLAGRPRTRVVLAVRDPYALWTTALVGRTVLVTRWWQPTGQARILRIRF
jgi:hypothetical protein